MKFFTVSAKDLLDCGAAWKEMLEKTLSSLGKGYT